MHWCYAKALPIKLVGSSVIWIHCKSHYIALRDSLNQQLAAQERYLDSLNITLQRARGLYTSGAVSYIEVLDAERSLFATRQSLLDLNYAQQVNEIKLFAALGGGWVE